ncbi:MAG: HAMP domain-containing sensor histidine kinase [bacterium]
MPKPIRINADIFILSFFLTSLIGFLDYFSGPIFSFSLFYLLPVYLASWFGNLYSGLTIAFTSAIIWFWVNYFLFANNIPSHIELWNTLIRAGIFCAVASLISKIKEQKKREEEYLHFIVHDLRTPTVNISMAIDMIKETPDQNNWQKLIEMVQISNQRLQTLVTSILDMAKIKDGKFIIQKDKINIKQLLDAAIVQVSVWALNNKVAISVEQGSKTKEILTDQQLLLRVFVNLLSNAIKVSKQDSKIIIKVEQHDHNLEICIIDQGPGIPKTEQNDLFKKFYRVNKHQGENISGTGLGLAFCRQAITAMGGTIRLESEEGKGTKIVFTLPLDPSSA